MRRGISYPAVLLIRVVNRARSVNKDNVILPLVESELTISTKALIARSVQR